MLDAAQSGSGGPGVGGGGPGSGGGLPTDACGDAICDTGAGESCDSCIREDG